MTLTVPTQGGKLDVETVFAPPRRRRVQQICRLPIVGVLRVDEAFDVPAQVLDAHFGTLCPLCDECLGFDLLRHVHDGLQLI